MSTQQIRQLQINLGVPATGVMDAATSSAMTSAISRSLESHPNFNQFSSGNSAESISNAFLTGDWSGVRTATGKPFTDEQQGDAVAQAERALAPGFNETRAYDTSEAVDTIEGQQESLRNFLNNDADNFQTAKVNADQNAAESGILYSGARTQKERDLKKLYEDRQAQQMGMTGRNIASTAKNLQYRYGADGVATLPTALPGGNSYNASVAGGAVTPKTSIASIYDPSKYSFQGTAVNANRANVQTRAAGLLANRANKLTSTGYKTQY